MSLSNAIKLISIAIACLLAADVQAQQDTEVMFILDSSGSMSEDAGGQRKIDAAKQVMRQIVPEIAKDAPVGLTVYGHRKKGDCSDIEVLVPPGSSDHLSLLQQVESLQPVGKTPISAAILTVAGLVKTRDVQTTVVLVSDGIETCAGDPCAVAEQLKQTGLKFVVHVVGFDVDANAAAQLSCIADKTGGKYYSANDTESLLDALRSVKNDVALQVSTARSKQTNVRSGIGKLRLVMPEGSQKSLAFVEVFRDEKKVLNVKRPRHDFKTPLTAGRYRVTAGFHLPAMAKPTVTDFGFVTVRRGETTDLRLGSISLNIPQELLDNESGKRLHIQEFIIADAGSNEPVVRIHANGHSVGSFNAKPVLGGVYNLLFKYYNGIDEHTVLAENVQVQPGRDAIVTLDSGIHMKKTEAEMTGWDLIPSAISSTAADNSEEGNATTEFAPFLTIRARGNFNGGSGLLAYPYLAPPGKYDIVVHMKGMTEPLLVGEGIGIKKGEVVFFDPGF